MTKRTLGSVVKEARDEARMTQRDLAGGYRRQSQPRRVYLERSPQAVDFVATRLRETLGLDGKEILMLAHPETRQLIETKTHSGSCSPRAITTTAPRQ